MAGKILVLGATGNVGAPLVQNLLEMGEKVVGASRDKPPRSAAGLEYARVDLQDAGTLRAALEGVDRVYALSPSGYPDQPRLLMPVIDAAKERNIKVVLQTAMGVEASDEIPLRTVELSLERAGVPFVILRPNWFSDNFATYWASHVIRGEIRLPAKDGTVSFVDARDIAAAAAVSLTTDRFDGKAYALTGPTAHGYAEAASMLSAVLGRTITYRNVDDEAFRAEAVASGTFSENYAGLLAKIFHPVAEGWVAGVTGDVQRLTGRQPRSLETSINDLAPRIRALAA